MCTDTYVPHMFLFQMFMTYLMYIIVTIIKEKWVAEKNAFKECFNCFNCSFKFTIMNVYICYTYIKLQVTQI